MGQSTRPAEGFFFRALGSWAEGGGILLTTRLAFIECFLCPALLRVLYLCYRFGPPPVSRHDHESYFTNEETEPQSSKITFTRSPGSKQEK